MEFFPSRTLALYMAKLFITRILAVLVMLVLILQMLDLLGESGHILAHPGNGEPEIWRYISLRVPQLIARFLPYSVLLATLLTLWPLNQNSEVVAMRAAGLSAHQILAPLLITALFVSMASFAFNERVVARAAATLKAWSAVEYAPIPEQTGVRSNVYMRDGPNILVVGTVSGNGPTMRLDNVTWYQRDTGGMITEQVYSPRAAYVGNGWKLDAPVRFEVAGTRQEKLAEMVVAPGVTPAQVAISSIDADGQNVVELSRSITALRAAGRRTSELDGKWWHKFSAPLSSVLMPLLGAVAAFGLARSGQLLIRAVIGMSLGFAYFVVDNAALAMGNFGGYPPFVAAWAPFLLFLLIGETVLVRTEE
jgi:lipopolysaccharide export system permease protein